MSRATLSRSAKIEKCTRYFFAFFSALQVFYWIKKWLLLCIRRFKVATKVKDTPILRGKDAERFNQKMKEAEKNPISKTEYERMLTVFKSVRIS